MASGRVRGGVNRSSGKNNSTIAASKVGVPLMIHRLMIYVGGDINGHPSGEETHPHRTNRTCLPVPPVVFTAIWFKSRLQHFVFSLQQFRSLLCVSRANILGVCWYSAIALRVLRRQHSERTGVVCPYRTHKLRTLNTPWFCGYRIQYNFHAI